MDEVPIDSQAGPGTEREESQGVDRIEERSSYRKIKQCRSRRGSLRIHVMKFAAMRSDAAADLPQSSRSCSTPSPSAARPSRGFVLRLRSPFGSTSRAKYPGARSHY